jgi:hypothetical protein
MDHKLSGTSISFTLSAKPVDWLPFNDLGLVSPDSGNWIMSIIRDMHNRGAGLMPIVQNIRDQGEQLSRNEKKALGVRANLKLGHRFVNVLTDKGRANPGAAADELVYTNYTLPRTITEANRMRADHTITHLYLIANEPGSPNVCTDAIKLARKGRILRTAAPALPLPTCTKRCGCWYTVQDDSFE